MEDLIDVATVSTGGDADMAKLIAEAFARVDMDAKVGASLFDSSEIQIDITSIDTG